MKKSVVQFDKSNLSQAVRTPQGYLKAPVAATRVGVFYYRMPDGSQMRQLRTPEEVFAQPSLDSLCGVPVTDDHPDVPLLTAENTRNYQRGYTGDNVTIDGVNVLTSATVTDSELISKIEDGKIQVSCGYTCDLDESPGLWNGLPYDVIQRNIIYNHLAVVEQGRAGPTVRIRLDSADAPYAVQDGELEPQTQGDDMNEKEIKLGEKTFKVKADIADAIEAQIKIHADAAQSAEGKASEAESKVASLSKEKDTLQAKHDSIESDLSKAKQISQDAASVDVKALVKARIQLEKTAQKIIKDGAESISELSDLDVKKAVILVDSPKAILDGKSEAYISARFDSIVERVDGDDAAAKEISEQLQSKNGNQDGAGSVNADDSRKRMIERAKNGYKAKLSASAEK